MTDTQQKDPSRGERIKYVRTVLLGLVSQEKFANWIGGVTRGAVGNWERGLHIGLDNLVTIAGKADISLEWLAYGKGARPTRTGDHPMQRSEDVDLDAALASFNALTPRKQNEFLRRTLKIEELDPVQQPGGDSSEGGDQKPQ